MNLQKCILTETDTSTYAMETQKIVSPPTFSKNSWRIAIVVGLVCALLVFCSQSTSNDLHKDSDTHVMVTKIRERHDPVSWFFGDWPLENHFYRPISALSFEIDNALYGDSGRGYFRTNAIVAALSVLALAWLVFELGMGPICAALVAAAWAVWLTGFSQRLLWSSEAVLLVVGGASAWMAGRRARSWKVSATGFFVGAFLATELVGIEFLPGRILDWIPGRTASLCTLFLLVALASGVSFNRKPTCLNGITSLLAGALALGSYEQAIVWFPVLLILLWRPRSAGPLSLSAGCSAAYVASRTLLLPSGQSAYQQQQFLSTGFSFRQFSAYFFPPYQDFAALPIRLESGFYCLLDGFFWESMVSIAAFAGLVVWVWHSPRRGLLIRLWLASSVAFLPMAWLSQFEHYHMLPMSLRAIFVAVLALDLFWPDSFTESRQQGQSSC